LAAAGQQRFPAAFDHATRVANEDSAIGD
jgi:hypothetical protein